MEIILLVHKLAPEINIETGEVGNLTVSLTDPSVNINGPANIKVCYTATPQESSEKSGIFSNN